MGQQNSKSSNKKGAPLVKEEPGNKAKNIRCSMLNAPSEKSVVEDHSNEEVSAKSTKVMTYSQLKEIKPLVKHDVDHSKIEKVIPKEVTPEVVLELDHSKLKEVCRTIKPDLPRDQLSRDAHIREQPVAPRRERVAAKRADPVMKVTDAKVGTPEIVPANDLNHLEDVSPKKVTFEVEHDFVHQEEVSPKKVTFEVEHDFVQKEEVSPKDVTPKIVPVHDLDHSKVKKVSPKKVTFEVVHSRLEEVAEVNYATVEFGKTGSFNPEVPRSTQHSSISTSCSESTFITVS